VEIVLFYQHTTPQYIQCPFTSLITSMNSDTPKLDRPRQEVGGLQGSLDHMLEKIQDSHSAELRSKDLRIQILEDEASILRQELDNERSRVKSFEADLEPNKEIVAALQKLMRADENHPDQKLEGKDTEEQAAQEVAASTTRVSPQENDAESTVTETSQIVSVPKKKRHSGAAQRKARKAKKAAAVEEDGK
jgi:chromosome segregation ATPase